MGFRAVPHKDTEDPHWLFATPLEAVVYFSRGSFSASRPAPHVQEWMAGSLWTLRWEPC